MGSWRCAPCLSIPMHPRKQLQSSRPLLRCVHPLLPPTAASGQVKRNSKARAPLHPSLAPVLSTSARSSPVQPQPCPSPTWEGSNRVPALPSSVTSATTIVYNTAYSPSTSGADVQLGVRCDCFSQSLAFTPGEQGRGRIQAQRFARWRCSNLGVEGTCPCSWSKQVPAISPVKAGALRKPGKNKTARRNLH